MLAVNTTANSIVCNSDYSEQDITYYRIIII